MRRALIPFFFSPHLAMPGLFQKNSKWFLQPSFLFLPPPTRCSPLGQVQKQFSGHSRLQGFFFFPVVRIGLRLFPFPPPSSSPSRVVSSSPHRFTLFPSSFSASASIHEASALLRQHTPLNLSSFPDTAAFFLNLGFTSFPFLWPRNGVSPPSLGPAPGGKQRRTICLNTLHRNRMRLIQLIPSPPPFPPLYDLPLPFVRFCGPAGPKGPLGSFFKGSLQGKAFPPFPFFFKSSSFLYREEVSDRKKLFFPLSLSLGGSRRGFSHAAQETRTVPSR